MTRNGRSRRKEPHEPRKTSPAKPMQLNTRESKRRRKKLSFMFTGEMGQFANEEVMATIHFHQRTKPNLAIDVV